MVVVGSVVVFWVFGRKYIVNSYKRRDIKPRIAFLLTSNYPLDFKLSKKHPTNPNS